MSSLSFGNVNANTTQVSPELEKRTQSQENFTAIDKEKLKEDTVQLTQNANAEIKENRLIKNIKTTLTSKDTKKTINSVLMILATIFGIGALGNSKLATKSMVEIGSKLDDIVKNNKLYQGMGDFFKSAKKSIGDFLLKSKTVQDISNTFKTNKAKPQIQVAQGMGQGFAMQFSNTVLDAFRTIKAKNPSNWDDLLGSIVGEKNVKQINKALENAIWEEGGRHLDSTEIASKIMDDISENFGCQNKADLYKILNQIRDGKVTGLDGTKSIDLKCFKDLKMNEEGILGNWYPAIWVEKLGQIFKKDFKFNRCNTGDALIKYGVSDGKLADTALGKLTQASLVVPAESISNFVCDSSTFNLMTLPAMFALYNNLQDAPKEKRGATIADDFIGSLGHMAIATPLAFGATYGLATLANLEGKTIFSKMLKPIGKFFGMGLPTLKDGAPVIKEPAKNIFQAAWRKTKGFGGGAMRGILILFGFSTLFSKPIQSVVHKVFGKPYDKTEAEKEKQLEEQKKQIIPELGITQGELMEKIQKNPKALEQLQTDTKLAQAIQENPKVILDLLDGKEIKYQEPAPTPAQQGQILSPANQKIMGNKTNATQANVAQATAQMATNETNATKSPTPDTTKTENSNNPDTASYIPSSEFVAPKSSMSQELSNEFNAKMAKADKVLAAAEKYI